MRILWFIPIYWLAIGCTVQVESPPPEAPPEDTPRPNEPLDLEDADDNLRAFWKMRGSLDPEEDVVFYWTGNIFILEERDPLGEAVNDFPGPVLQFEGFNIARFEEVEDGVRMVSREVAVYKDVAGQIIDCWYNASLGVPEPRGVRAMHVWNDPVNHTLGGADYDELGEQIVFNTEILLNYTSPLPVAGYEDYSAGNTYQTAEIFNWYVDRADLEDPTMDSAPATISWSRVGQFLPWMQAGQWPGKLLYHTRGRKLPGGFDELPQDLKDYVLEHGPEYTHAPETDESPNDTTWRVFKRLLDSGGYEPGCW